MRNVIRNLERMLLTENEGQYTVCLRFFSESESEMFYGAQIS